MIDFNFKLFTFQKKKRQLRINRIVNRDLANSTAQEMTQIAILPPRVNLSPPNTRSINRPERDKKAKSMVDFKSDHIIINNLTK